MIFLYLKFVIKYKKKSKQQIGKCIQLHAFNNLSKFTKALNLIYFIGLGCDVIFKNSFLAYTRRKTCNFITLY